MTFSYINTERLKLRMCNQEVLDYVHQHYSQDDLMIFFGSENEEALSKEVARYHKGLQTFNKHFLYFYLIEKTSDRVIGWCGFHTWYIDHRRAEIGYVMDDVAFRNKGLMKEAITSILNYGFTTMKLHRIEALVGPENVPSLKLMDHFGFEQEGHLKEHYMRNGIVEDSLIFALFNS